MSRSGAGDALIVDPGDEPERVERALERDGLRCVGILLTHAHFDHVGAVASLARSHSCPVYTSKRAADVLLQIAAETPAGFPAIEPYDADVRLAGDETLRLAGLDVRCHLAEGHAPGHLVYEVSDPADGQTTLFVGDVIFRGSVGRTDFPGCSWEELEASILRLYASCPLDAPVLSGHSGPTTLAHERDTNPFLDAVRSAG